MTDKHTPGSYWIIEEPVNRTSDFDGEHQIIAPNGVVLARLAGYNRAERAANARTFAAAPELLKALKRFIDDANNTGAYSPQTYDMALTAIAEAEGGAHD